MKKTNLQAIAVLGLGLALAAGLAWYYDVFVHWQPKVYPFVLAALFAGVLALTLLTLWVRGERKASPLIWKTLLSFAAFGISIGLVTFIINNVIGGSARAKNAASVALPLAAAQILVLIFLALRAIFKQSKKGVKAALALSLACALALGVFLGSLIHAPLYKLAPQFPAPQPKYEKPAEDDYALWEARTYEALAGDLSEALVSDDSGTLAWGTSYALNAYCRAYQATGDELFLEKPGGYLYEIFQLAGDNDGDGYKNWGTGYFSGDTYEEFCVHTGALLSTAGEWANLAFSTPGILDKIEPISGMTYAGLCDYLVTEATTHMIPAFDREWDNETGVYLSPPGSIYFDGQRISLPNNQFLAMAAALMQFAKLSPAHEEEYLRRASAMLEAFHAKLEYDENGNITRWNYKDSYFKGDTPGNVEDHSHGRWVFRAAIMGYADGLAFTRRDIAAFAGVYGNMLRGTDEPLLTRNVDGSGAGEDPVGLFHYDLSPFGEDIWRAGHKTVLVRGAAAYAHDVARLLAYHEYAPAPLAFALLESQTGQAGRTLFRWEASAHACKYTLQISGDESFSNLLLDRANILDTCAFVEGLPEGGTLYWRVIAKNQSGAGYTSGMREATT